jgi:Fe-S-cluster-containing dehydrogenase component
MNGLLIDWKYCTGCHACEVACKKELNLAKGQFGIHVLQDGPRELPNNKWEYSFIPVKTSLCDLCNKRTEAGRPPSCVHHCPARIIHWGTIEELATVLAKKSGALLYSE